MPRRRKRQLSVMTMYNIFDYLEWRGDLSFGQAGICDADAVILSRLSYLPFDGVVSEKFDNYITVSQAADRIFSGDAPAFLWEGDDRLLRALAGSRRYSELSLCGYVNEVDDERQMQFSAMLINLGDGIRFISFRGTDNTLVGWQEDFNMFFTFPVASQIEAKRYFDAVVSAFDGELCLGGHSKGGNLAVYVSAFSAPEIQDRILSIYSMDGPGFEMDHIKDSGFERIVDKIHTYVPQSSIFGMLFEHEESYTVIKSSQKGFLQHDVYSWEIKRDSLVELRRTNGTSAFFDHTLTQFIEKMTFDERRDFTEAIFNIMKSTEEYTFDDMADKLIKDIPIMLKTFTKLDSETRSMIGARLLSFLKTAGGNISDINPLTRENRRIRKEQKPKKYRKKNSKGTAV